MTDSPILAADYHRNGVAGAGFYVALVNDPDDGRMLVVAFAGEDEVAHTAVLNIDQAHAGNIYMLPEPGRPGTGGNAWRGDRYADRYRAAIIERASAVDRPDDVTDTAISEGDVELVQTCSACPEQYEARVQGRAVGYLRLRHGFFTVRTEPDRQLLYQAQPEGDGLFEPDERERYLREARMAIAQHLNRLETEAGRG